MNIVVLSGSPRKGGNTAIIAGAFKEGAESAGHSVEVVDVAAKKIASKTDGETPRKYTVEFLENIV